MDAVQFGRWLSERRRRFGWRSQRALAETANSDFNLSGYHITEDFLARVEKAAWSAENEWKM